ncbi:membrane-associated kinase regulator 5-like [Oryza brachyantha]|uniref:membrane-associated kinase regulator 5-like n=1 Tax=Oryza brachyantha TaxID=4533 RepID=UPI001ADA2F3C|nr:membrane-associated kinase regulator 5-like [Oryza brachyantha]
MHIFRLLAAGRRRRAVSTITAAAAAPDAGPRDSEDDGPFFDLDFSSVRASSTTTTSDSDDDCTDTDLDFIISLHRSRSASPSYDPLFFAAASASFRSPHHFCAKRRAAGLRTLSFGAKNAAAFYGGGGRHSFARSSCSARSLRLFMETAADDGVAEPRRAPPSDVIRSYLTKISRRFRRTSPRAAAEARGLRRLRKSRSASAATLPASSSSSASRRRDDSLLEKQDGIASAIAHCKESLHRASVSDCDSSLSRSRSDPGKRQA